MRYFLFALGFFVVTAAITTRAEAQNYPWCAIYDGSFGGRNCGFTTFEQCQATISGIGGFCNLNTLYEPPGVPAPRSHTKHKPHKNS